MTKVDVVTAHVVPRLRLQLVASERISKGEVIVRSNEREVQQDRTWRTLQVGENRHLRNEFLNFADHSCDPNAVLDSDKLTLIAVREIRQGEAVTFFYPGSEVELSQSFECQCGADQCLKQIRGGFYLTPDQMRWVLHKGYATNFMKRHFERLLESRPRPEARIS
ncbi:MAG TPA: SET domain-containing protein-lysine N-methyltransferase [Xanthomonadales bacterium]|nr:SET domain-containing protein-lysine N-methyltransferase [Xanthomonadales bacterium]